MDKSDEANPEDVIELLESYLETLRLLESSVQRQINRVETLLGRVKASQENEGEGQC